MRTTVKTRLQTEVPMVMATVMGNNNNITKMSIRRLPIHLGIRTNTTMITTTKTTTDHRKVGHKVVLLLRRLSNASSSNSSKIHLCPSTTNFQSRATMTSTPGAREGGNEEETTTRETVSKATE